MPTPPLAADIEAALVDADAIVRRRWRETRIARHEAAFPVNRWAEGWYHAGWIQHRDNYGWWLTLNVWMNAETGERRIMDNAVPDDLPFDPKVRE